MAITNVFLAQRSPTANGNGLIATTSIDAGSAILTIPQPFLSILETASLTEHCSTCFLSPSERPLKRCGSCKTTWYCSLLCQKRDWNATHKLACPVYQLVKPRVLPTGMRALLQVLLPLHKKRTHSRDDGEDAAHKGTEWLGLESHEQEMISRNTERWNDIQLQIKMALTYGQLPESYMRLAIAFMCRISVNAFRITQDNESPIGMCFDPILALANHSCSPNAFVIFNGRSVSLHAFQDLKTGQEIRVSYVDTTQEVYLRQAQLRDRYYFTCQCDKCTDDDSSYAHFMKSPQKESSRLDLFIKHHELLAITKRQTTNMSPSTIPAPVPQSSKPSLDQKCSDPFRLALHKHATLVMTDSFASPPLPSLLHDRYLDYLTAKDFISALSVLVFIHLYIDTFLYPQPFHPRRVTTLYTIARLLKTIACHADREDEYLAVYSTDLNSTPNPQPITARSAWNALAIDPVRAHFCVLALARDHVPSSHGPESKFATVEIAQDWADVCAVMEGAADLDPTMTVRPREEGEALLAWAMRYPEGPGKVLAEQTFAQLREAAAMVRQELVAACHSS